ncbi:phage tail fiber protein [Xenorhabdus sp. KK7.4]|uniref:phage tail fiber protein n=1 Tax=Xenorhabdus sp. KK7.4 TaxID=1851572 RepID=UPI000C05EA27|nr:phage tail protein [Xenorhabdus sp. KK7.4]PHM48243.1 tail protein [Xenorhabdus sp. KK7.4]
MQDKKPDVPVSDDSNLVIVTTPEYVKEAIAEHAASRNHPDATLQDKGFVILSNDTGSDSETMAATPKAVKTAYDLASIANQHASNANNNANTRLAKDQNGADIPNKISFVNNLGLKKDLDGKFSCVEYQIGPKHDVIDFDKIKPNSTFYGYREALNSSGMYGVGMDVRNASDQYGFQLHVYYNTPRIRIRNVYLEDNISIEKWTSWSDILVHGTSAIVDASGSYKPASPNINIWTDGKYETNTESQNAIVERLSEGIYLIKGIMGFNTDEAMNNIEIPLCQNKLPLVWVNHEILPDGSIKLMTYHREHSDAPAFARNIREGYADGDLIDIPDGRFVSVRVQMPDTK